MVDTNKNQSNEINQTFINLDSIPGIQQIGFKSQQVGTAIKELSDTYLYASLCVESASHFAQRIQEMRTDNPGKNRSPHFQACYKTYIKDIEKLLDNLSNLFTTMVQQNLFENYIHIVVSEIGSLINYIKKSEQDSISIFLVIGISLLSPLLLIIYLVFFLLISFGILNLTSENLIKDEGKKTRQGIDNITHGFLDKIYDPPFNKEK